MDRRSDRESNGSGSPSAVIVRAAEYVRMSTDHQKYSTENQAEAIRQYAARRGIEIVRTYADEGKSGLRLDGRDALKRLIDDVQSGATDFTAILVYDVSRWGRFQDADESAYYEYICKRAGISVQYCAEQFENDGSPVSTIVKGVKRAMAGEYSRELSVKVFTGQCRLIELGYRQGGPPGFGLRRSLIDQSGAPKGELARGAHKSIQTDRVVLVPGPTEEIEIVRWIYRSFVSEKKTESEIADALNERGVVTDLGRSWTRGTVHQILINEKYIGNNVWNRASFKLKRKRIHNLPAMWIRADGAFKAIVDRTMFDAAQAIIHARSLRLSDEEMLKALQQLLQDRGYLSGLLIDESENLPSSSAYQSRFGSLLRAYQLVGFAPDRDYRYVEINRTLRRMHPQIVTDTVTGIRQAGGLVEQDPESDLLTINREFTASVVVVRCLTTSTGSRRWKIRFDVGLWPDITVAVRMDEPNQNALDYYLLPRIDMTVPNVRLAEDNGVSLDAYRFETLDAFFALAARATLQEVA
ncbi:MAG: Recombinase [Pseudolabrys sp.]|jgi:DNA invertase Pin-like site-specific DNA recombinase|nr:Recombinase [Pseudolabrys sp.]